MFKSLISVVLVFFGFQLSQARSLAPSCAPVIKAQPTQLNCVKKTDGGKIVYSIVISTKMSPAECRKDGEYVEIKHANITISSGANGPLAKVKLTPGTFEYEYNQSFSSAILGLQLDDCVSPMNGGFSIGN